MDANVESIFSSLAKHMITGLMVHDQFNSYYTFLNLPSYARCHKEHYDSESCNYFKLKHHYMKAHDKLIKEQAIANPETIPASWNNYSKIDVDTNTKRTAVRDGLKKWMDWEKETKTLYETAYTKLLSLNEVDDAIFVKHLIKEVSCELAEVKKWYIEKQDCDFSISSIIEDQK